MNRQGAPRTPLLSLAGIEKSFAPRKSSFFKSRYTQPARLVLDSVSLALYPGKITALVGESGSGKSTLGRVLSRIIEPSSGQLLFEGRDVLATEASVSSHFRRRVQMVLQDPFASLNPQNTIGYQLARPLLRHGLASRSQSQAEVAKLLTLVGLSPDLATRRPHELSGGQRQRVAIARAIAVEPAVIIADEPTSMLDVSVRMGILNLMRELCETRNIAWLHITHDLASARYVSDEIYVLFGGQIVECGSTERVLHRPSHPYTQQLLSCVPGAVTAASLSQPSVPAAPVLEPAVVVGHDGPRPSHSAPVKPLVSEPVITAAIVKQRRPCAFADRCQELRTECRQQAAPKRSLSLTSDAWGTCDHDVYCFAR